MRHKQIFIFPSIITAALFFFFPFSPVPTETMCVNHTQYENEFLSWEKWRMFGNRSRKKTSEIEKEKNQLC